LLHFSHPFFDGAPRFPIRRGLPSASTACWRASVKPLGLEYGASHLISPDFPWDFPGVFPFLLGKKSSQDHLVTLSQSLGNDAHH
jgi:hypothetical protein